MDKTQIVLFLIFILILYLIKFFKGKDIKKTKPNLKPLGYHLIYTDQKEQIKKQDVTYSSLLKSTEYDLQGKPDYIFQKGNTLLPVELKSGKIGSSLLPHHGDFMQLLAYFIIIEEEYGVSPRYGRLIYSDYMFIIKNTKKFKSELLIIIDEMRQMLITGENSANPSFNHCRHCICRGTVCEHCK